MSVCLCIHLSVTLYLSVCLPLCLPASVFICHCTYLPLYLYLPLYFFVYMSIYLSVRLCLSVHLSPSLPFCLSLSACLCVSVSLCLSVYRSPSVCMRLGAYLSKFKFLVRSYINQPISWAHWNHASRLCGPIRYAGINHAPFPLRYWRELKTRKRLLHRAADQNNNKNKFSLLLFKSIMASDPGAESDNGMWVKTREAMAHFRKLLLCSKW